MFVQTRLPQVFSSSVAVSPAISDLSMEINAEATIGAYFVAEERYLYGSSASGLDGSVLQKDYKVHQAPHSEDCHILSIWA